MGQSAIKKFLPRGLFARSLLILTVPILLIQVITTFVFFDRYWDEVTGRLVDGVVGEIAAITQMVEEEPPRYQFYEVQVAAEKNLSIVVTKVEGDHFKKEQTNYPFWNSWAHLLHKALQDTLDYRLNRSSNVLINMSDKNVMIAVPSGTSVLKYEFNLKRIFSSSSYIFLLWMIGASFVLLIVAILFMRNQIRPIKRLAVAADRFGKGRDIPFFKVSGSSEVRLAAQSFLDMKERINRQIQQRTSMLAGVSHDLRTPLTRMKLQLEMMKESDDVAAMKSDIKDMEKMIDAYLQFVRGEGDEELNDINLKELIERAITSLDHVDTKFIINASDVAYILPVKEMAIERCFINLLSNADRYADKVEITLSQNKEMISTVIDDNGPGMSEEEYQEVFKPFYRVDKSRNSKTGSVGLGLTITQDIILSHGGHVALEKSPLGGLRVKIELPR